MSTNYIYFHDNIRKFSSYIIKYSSSHRYFVVGSFVAALVCMSDIVS